MFKIRFISMLVLLCLTVSGAWAQEETLLTTILSADNTSFTSGSKTFDNKATVTFSGTVMNFGDESGWYSNEERTLTVTAAQGYTITRVKFYNYSGSAFDEEAPFEAILVYEGGAPYGVVVTKVNGTSIGGYGVTKIEVYGYNAYKVSLKGGTEDATSWQGKAGEGEYQALPLEGVALGTAVSVKYSGWKLVKSVKGKKPLNLTSPAVGQVIGDDGKNYDYASLPGGVTAVAKICYVSGSNGLALALTDEGQMNWNTAMTTAAAHTPAFTGGTWKLATKDEWTNMITAAGSYTVLRDGFSSVGGSNMQSGYYWSSTEGGSSSAWGYGFDDGYWARASKDDGGLVRACLAFGAQETVTLNHSANNTWAIAEMPDGDVELEMEYFNITVPTANTADIYAGWTTPLINAGSTTEDGATMKYLVTATNEQPTSTDGFSTDVPTAQGRTAGTYYVWYYLDFASGDDSDISALAVEVTVIAAPTHDFSLKEGTEDATSWQGKAGEGEYQALPLEGVALGTAVSVKYSGWKLVKRVNAKKKATAEDKGKLIGRDGKIYDTKDEAEDAGTTAVAKIIYIGPTDHATYRNGLALALTDEGWMMWQDAILEFSVKNRTTPVTGATWLLASKDEWNNMITAAGGYEALRDGFSSVGGSNLQSDHEGLYWSSTDIGSTYEKWCYVFDDGHWGYNNWRNNCWARACLAFGALKTVTQNHSANNTWTIAEMPDADVDLEVEYFNITVPTANTADIYAGWTTPLINAGSTTEDGATMKYLVTATNEQPTSTDGFSTDVPTAQGRTAGTYYVWYYLDFASGDDSDISALAVEVTVSVHVTMKEGTFDADNWQGKAGEGEYQALPLTDLEPGTAVTVKYNGTKLVKSVKAKKKAKAAAEATAEDKGKLIGADGNIYADVSAATVAGTTAVAKIFYVSGSNVLALALADEGKMNWSTAISTCAAHTPAFTGGTWKLATEDEWRNMITAAGSYTVLRDGFESVGGSNLQSAGYWSSTEYDSDYAYFYHFDNDQWYVDYKTCDYFWVRACLAFGAGSGPDPIELTSTDGETWTLASMPDYDVELEVTYYPTHAITVKEGTLDATSWQGKAGEGNYQALPLERVIAGTALSVKYNGTKKVKSVKAKGKPATAEDKGKLIGADGNIYDTKDEVEDAGATAVAKIIYIGPTGHDTYNHGLALALTDERGGMTWGAAIDACSAKNTSTPVTGATWLLASKDQWNYMMGADGAGSYAALRDGFSSVGGSNLLWGTWDEYWSSSESNTSDGWHYSFYADFWTTVNKGYEKRVRACLAFGAQEPDPIELTSTDGKTWTLASMPYYDVKLEVEYETELALSETTDNSAALTEWNGYEADVTLTRTLQTGSYNTFAAPFDINSADMTSLGITAKELESSSFVNGTLTLNFATAASIEAGKPYLVKVAANTDLSAAPFTGVIVSKDAQPFTSTDVDFIPTLGATTIEGSDTKSVLFLAAGNKLLNPSALPANMKGFRAYFQLKGEAALAKSFNIDFGNGETTGINLTPAPSPKGEGGIYTLDGRRISKATQKGVYIQNGKKVIK